MGIIEGSCIRREIYITGLQAVSVSKREFRVEKGYLQIVLTAPVSTWSSSAHLAETHAYIMVLPALLHGVIPDFVRPVKCRRITFFCIADGASASDRNGSAKSLRRPEIILHASR